LIQFDYELGFFCVDLLSSLFQRNPTRKSKENTYVIVHFLRLFQGLLNGQVDLGWWIRSDPLAENFKSQKNLGNGTQSVYLPNFRVAVGFPP